MFPIFADAERVIADPVVRNRGTIGGSLCQADPSEDLSAVCTTLDASCVIRGAGGERVVSMEDFHRGPYETAVGARRDAHRDPDPGAAATAPAPTRRSSAGPATGRSTSAGAAVWMDGGVITDARVGLAAVGPNTDRHPGDLRGAARPARPSEELYAQAGAIAAAELLPGHRQPRHAPTTSGTSPTS